MAVVQMRCLLLSLILSSTADRKADLGVLSVGELAMSLTSYNTQESCTAQTLRSSIELALGCERRRAVSLNKFRNLSGPDSRL